MAINWQIIGGILTLILPFLKYISSLYNNSRKKQKQDLLRKHIDFMSLYDKEYVNSVILDQYKRLIFKDFTGIYLSPERQKVLVNIYKKFENDVGWRTYRFAFQYMNFEGESLEIRYKKKNGYFFICYLVIATSYFFTIASLYINSVKTDEIILVFVFYLIGLLGLYFTYMVIMQIKRLNKLKLLLDNNK